MVARDRVPDEDREVIDQVETNAIGPEKSGGKGKLASRLSRLRAFFAFHRWQSELRDALT